MNILGDRTSQRFAIKEPSQEPCHLNEAYESKLHSLNTTGWLSRRVLSKSHQALGSLEDLLVLQPVSSVAVKTAPTETLSRLESMEAETRPRLLGLETKTRPRLYMSRKNNNKTGRNLFKNALKMTF